MEAGALFSHGQLVTTVASDKNASLYKRIPMLSEEKIKFDPEIGVENPNKTRAEIQFV